MPGAQLEPLEFDLEHWLARLETLPPIVQAGSTVLRRIAHPVPRQLFGTPALNELAELMTEVMRQAPGVGLAAPQIGVPLRVFVAEDPDERISQIPEEARRVRARMALPLTVLINPVVDGSGERSAIFFEGCLSVRGYAALVPRWESVRVSGLDLQGRPVSLQLKGWPARIMQHEMDHLNGKLYVDRMITRSLAAEPELRRLSSMPVEDVLRELGEPASKPRRSRA